mmetsp:Transcript_2506/g.7224  ORF Transcript_2506/g.7224 Transcript_2506/m.7224 type:complete len:416 (+) Transcript_2506:80-1327(+)
MAWAVAAAAPPRARSLFLHGGQEDGLVQLHLCRALLRLGLVRHERRQLLEGGPAAHNFPAERGALVAGVALVDQRAHRAFGLHARGVAQPSRIRIHAVDVADEEVLHIGRLAAHLCVEVEPAGREPALLEYDVHDVRGEADVVREHVRVPAEHGLVPVGVDGAQLAKGGRHGRLVLARVPRERAVVRLEVERKLVLQPVLPQEAEDRGRVVVVLMRHWLARLGLEQQRAAEADLVLVLGHHREEAGEVVELEPHVRVEDRLVALAAAPEHVVLPAQPVRHLEALLDRGRSTREHRRVRIRGGAIHVPARREEVCGPPKQLEAARRLDLAQPFRDDVKVCVGLGLRCALGPDVKVVKAVVRCADLFAKLRVDVHPPQRHVHLAERSVLPRSVDGAVESENVAAVPAPCVPVRNTES